MTDDELKSAAQRLGLNLALGTGKTAKIIDDLKTKLGTKCPYCNKLLTLDNCVYDHKKAIGSVRRRKAKGVAKKALDNWDNLHLICKPCNLIKSDLNHDEYLGLLEYFSKCPTARKKMLTRFRKERASYMYKRRG